MRSRMWMVAEAIGYAYAGVTGWWWDRFRWFGVAGMFLCSFTMFMTAHEWRSRSTPKVREDMGEDSK